ncbi:HAD-like protein [Lentithecium fluviatile CBS 122367]|uniref:HAD-like protein n=1 Tax=Lentithecium fluviatile CBS 122367 TaxID=1168545 RepID=A0A6G1IFQ5_9PLEO|nr:HAD-like protein [Lentithecium fluviatile CBS 122367]
MPGVLPFTTFLGFIQQLDRLCRALDREVFVMLDGVLILVAAAAVLTASSRAALDVWDEDARSQLVHQWHVQTPWPDVIPALRTLREKQNWFLVVLTNGTTRLQLDIAQSSGIPFHKLLSSELLGLTKPDPAIYRKAMELVRIPPENCYMLASHLYDLEAAKAVGMRTIYVHRTTEDVGVDIELNS